MKPQKYGTCSEQTRFHAEWRTATTQEKSANKSCQHCKLCRITKIGEKFYGLPTIQKPSHYCEQMHLMTKPNAICKHYQPK